MMRTYFPVRHYQEGICTLHPPSGSARICLPPALSSLRTKLACTGKAGFCFCLFALLTLLFCGSPVQAQSQPGADDTTQVKSHLKEILSQPEFRPEEVNGPMAEMSRALRKRWDSISHWFQERWKAFQRFLDRLFSFAGPAGGPIGSVVSYIFCVIAIGAGIALIAWLIALIIRHFWLNRKNRKAQERTAFDESEGDDPMVTEPDAWLQQARKFAEAEDYRRAFRCVFLAVLLLMDQGGLIEFDRSRTNGDYLRLLARQGLNRLLEALRPLVHEFDRRWYRHDETNEADYQHVLAEFEQIRALMTEETPGRHAGAVHAAAGKA